MLLQIIVPFFQNLDLEDSEAEDAKETVNYLNDICSEQKSSTVRCHCAKLLCALGEHSAGFLTFATNIC
jgi:hypothetical protein